MIRGLQPVVGVREGRGQRLDGRFADFPNDLRRGLTNLVFLRDQQAARATGTAGPPSLINES